MSKLYYFTISICLLLFISSCAKKTEACFTYSPTTIAKNAVVTFNASCCKEASNYTWDFGDGTNEKTVTAITVTHKFTATGTYTVKLTAKRDKESGSNRSVNSTSQTIIVQ